MRVARSNPVRDPLNPKSKLQNSMSNKAIEAVLVRLNISIFPNTRQDPAITDEVRARKSLGIGAGKWIKHMFPVEAFDPIRKIGGEARRKHYDQTLPWEDNNRLLTVAARSKYHEGIDEFRAAFDEAAAAFLTDYDNWLNQARIMHGKTFNEVEYPLARDMKSHFGFAIEYYPVPHSSHFIMKGVAQKAVDEMRLDLESRNQTRLQEAVRDTWRRLMDPIQKIADTLSSPDSIFRDTLVGNVNDIVDLVPALNVTGDHQLVAFANDIKTRFASLDPQILRNDNAVRKDTAAAARAMLERFGSVGKRKFAA
jgi:hypothetical protein